MLDSPDHLLIGQTLKGNGEFPYMVTKQKEQFEAPSKMAFVFLRNPINHVVSQFMECKYDDWGKRQTKGSGFPGYGALGNAFEGFDEWVAHFATNPDSYAADHAFHCYDPWNMQARKMTLTSKELGHIARNPDARFPPLDIAKSNLQDIELILGITEHYSASMCLLEYHAAQGNLTEACRTCDYSTHSLPLVEAKQHHSSHGVPPHSLDMITNQTTVQCIAKLTEIDQQMYDYALTLFMNEVEIVKNETGVDLLCRDQVEGLGEPITAPPSAAPTNKPATAKSTENPNSKDTANPTNKPTAFPTQDGEMSSVDKGMADKVSKAKSRPQGTGNITDMQTAAVPKLQQEKIGLSILNAMAESRLLLIIGFGLLLVIRWYRRLGLIAGSITKVQYSESVQSEAECD